MGRNDTPHPTCTGICKKYVVNKSPRGKRYSKGQKRCQMCLVFINYEGPRCPCCGYLLRTRPRSRIPKEKLGGITRI